MNGSDVRFGISVQPEGLRFTFNQQRSCWIKQWVTVANWKLESGYPDIWIRQVRRMIERDGFTWEPFADTVSAAIRFHCEDRQR